MGKGVGETTLELDRRKICDQLAELRRELMSVQGEESMSRAAFRTFFRCLSSLIFRNKMIYF